ncbi:synaptogyrin-2a [Conger conger]|uniref:synaptogyrin-2a n=1 Tax=Conger conger TaxID=82655 RepID=UPI002A59963B|nr:synaptogyrin-2a [Conger conger]
METGAYGASLAGGAFDIASFLKQPQTILRILSWVFAIVVFATITAEGYVTPSPAEAETKCMFNAKDSACQYGLSIGILAFMACVAFLVVDAYFPQISNAKDRKYIVTADLIFSGVWTFLWFVCFCHLANLWSHTDIKTAVADAARAVVAFSFFSTVTWGLLTFFALTRYRQGVTEFGETYTDPVSDHTTPYPPYPTSGPESYQQSPYTPQSEPFGEGGYQPPVY